MPVTPAAADELGLGEDRDDQRADEQERGAGRGERDDVREREDDERRARERVADDDGRGQARNVVTGDSAMSVLMDGIPEHLLAPRPNVFRLTLHPEGLAPRLANLAEVRALTLDRLRHEAATTGGAELRALYDEVSAYPVPAQEAEPPAPPSPASPVQVPLRIRTPLGELSMFSTMTTFGTPADVTLSELAIELFYPLDDFTKRVLRGRG
uniref:MmyB family transcriptional regulator n=2 Tax=Streptomyces TaxID=1883 RepID=UPI002F908F70